MSVADQLSRAGYRDLFQRGERNVAPGVWQDGANRAALEEIVAGDAYDDLQRLLAAEVLHAFGHPAGDRDVLARVYARALARTGSSADLSGNQWGFLYRDGGDDGPLGAHLLATGEAAVGPLAELLDDSGRLRYEGSREATFGNSLRYRVKDAAAFFIGRLTGRDVPFHDEFEERDEEIARLKAALDG
jgi:hypothetical protein